MLCTHSLVSQSNFYWDAYLDLWYKYKTDIPASSLDSLIEATKQVSDNDTIEGSYIAMDYAKELYYVGNLAGALKYGKLGVELFEENGIAPLDYASSLFNLGTFLRLSNQYKSAVVYFERLQGLTQFPTYNGGSYGEAARCYNFMGDPYKAISFYEKGQAMLENNTDSTALSLLPAQLMNHADVCLKLETPEKLAKALQLLTKADSLDKLYPMNALNKRLLATLLAEYYIQDQTFDFDKAKSYYELNLETAANSQDSLNVALAYNNLSNLYNLEELDSAFFYAKEGLKFQKDPDTHARLYDNISQYHLLRKEFGKAYDAVHQALEINLNQKLEPYQRPSSFELSQSLVRRHCLNMLKKVVDLLIQQSEAESDQQRLWQALEYIRAADEFITYVQEGSYEVRTQFYWQDLASEIYLYGVYTGHQLNQPDIASYFMEKNKAFLLAAEIQRNQAYTELPKTVSDELTAVKSEVLKIEALDLAQFSRAEKEELNASLFQAKARFEVLQDSVQQAFPERFAEETQLTVKPFTEIQQSLEKDVITLAYLWNTIEKDSTVVLGLMVGSHWAETFQVEDVRELDSLIGQYRQKLEEPLETKTASKELNLVAHKLYQILIPDLLKSRLGAGKELRLMLDGPLQSIPFEALVPDENSTAFLIETLEISYLYSHSFLEYSLQQERQTEQSLLGYAPTQFPEQGLSALPNTQKEVESINALLGGEIQVGAMATKTDFLNNSSDFQVIHLATHASAEADPWIAFADENLKLSDLYSYKNNADLVVLSGCNTSIGELARGEGVISLSRGFFYSGASSIVSSLWNVNDQATQEIMTDFYSQLKGGATKSEALTRAKRNYLKRNELSARAPYYWSSFVLIGDPGELNTKRNYYPILALGLLFILLLLFRKKVIGRG